MGFITVGLLEAQHTPLKEIASAKVEVMMMTAFRKLALRPCASFRYPSSENLEQQVENIRVGFSTSSSRTTE